MKRIGLIPIFFLIFPSFMNLNAQLLKSYEWLKSYEDGSACSIQLTSDGGYIVVGHAGCVIKDAMLLKLDPAGNIEWKRIYGDVGEDYDVRALSVQQTSDGGYIVAGDSGEAWHGPKNLWVMKLDSAADIEWQREYGGNEDDCATSIQLTSDGGYIVAGGTKSFGAGGEDIWIIKLSSDGEIEWQRAYGGSDYDRASSIQETCDGGYIAVGTSSLEYYYGAILVLKLDSAGDIEWQRTYGGYNDYASSIQQTSDEGYIVAGDTHGIESVDAWILKLGSAGDIEWQRAYGGNEEDRASCIQETSDGGYIVAGGTKSFGAGGEDSWILKLDSAGDIELQRTCGGNEDESASYIQETSDGGYIVACTTFYYGIPSWGSPPQWDIWILKFFSDGDINASCDYIKGSNSTITDTDISPEALLFSYQDTSALPMDTDFPARSSYPTIEVLCPEHTSDVDDEDGKEGGCFIATAAYGSPLHPHIEILRDFRNKYLMPNRAGRKFVAFYYRYSPFLADIVAQHKALKIAVQIHLLPGVVICYSMVHFGLIIPAGILLLIIGFPVFFGYFYRR